MDVYSDIKSKLQKICQPKGLRLYFAEIVSIQDDTTCTVKLEDDLQLSDVRLRSVVNSEESGIVITPAVGSVVLVADLSGGKLSSMAVIMYSEIDKIEINGGKNGGLINIEDLVSHINTIEDVVKKDDDNEQQSENSNVRLDSDTPRRWCCAQRSGHILGRAINNENQEVRY